jgi:hypothetical protein
MNHIKKITTHILPFLLAFILLSSITNITIATEGNQQGQGSGHQNESPGSNNSQQTNQNSQQGETSGSQNQQQNQNQGTSQTNSGQGNQQNQNQQCENQNGSGFQKRYQYRKLNCTGQHNQSRIRSHWNLNNTQDAFEIDFITEPLPTLTMDYMPTADPTDIQLTFTIKIDKIIEFTDENLNNRYDHSDTIESIYSFKNINFTDIEYNSPNQTANKSLLQMKTQTQDSVFIMDLVISNNFTQFKNQYLSPAEMKIDFTIQNYSFHKNNSLLALFVDIISEHNLSVQQESFDEKQGYATNESAMKISSNKYTGFFSWVNNVIVDGTPYPVHASYLKEEYTINQTKEHVQYLSFTYPQGSTIIHDPKIGVISQSFTTNPENGINIIDNLLGINIYLSYIISIILAAILFMGIITIRKRL